MMAAGGKKPIKEGQRGISDVWGMGGKFEMDHEKPPQRDPLGSKDINGSVKKNQFGQVISMPS